MEAFGQEREAELRKFLELPDGIPDESTFFRVFPRVNPKALSARLYAWITEARELYQPEVNIDGKTIRGHWSIENRLHWSLDAALVSRRHGPENLNILRKTALPLLRAAPNPRPTGKKRFTAAMNPDYMFTVIFEK